MIAERQNIASIAALRVNRNAATQINITIAAGDALGSDAGRQINDVAQSIACLLCRQCRRGAISRKRRPIWQGSAPEATAVEVKGGLGARANDHMASGGQDGAGIDDIIAKQPDIAARACGDAARVDNARIARADKAALTGHEGIITNIKG